MDRLKFAKIPQERQEDPNAVIQHALPGGSGSS